MINKKDQRNYFIDLLKIFAILFVIIGHVFYFAPSIGAFPGDCDAKMRWGFPFYIYQGVPIFMVLSGFSWTLSLKKNNFNSIKQCFNTKAYIYILKKFLRIFIPYVILFLMLFTCEKCTKMHGDINWLTCFFAGGISQFGHYYVPLLFEMIIFIPLVYLIIKKWNNLGFLYLFIFNVLFEVIRWACHMPISQYQFYIFRHTVGIAFGVWLGFNIGKKYNWWISLIFFIFGIGMVVWFFYTPYKFKFFYNNGWKQSNFLTYWYIIPILGFLIRKCRFSNKYIAYPGKATYSIFLIQYFVCQFYPLFKVTNNELAQIFIAIIFIFLISTPFYIVSEKLAANYSIKLVNYTVNKYRLKHSKQNKN